MRQSYPVSIIILLIAIFALNACDGASGRNSTMGRQASMVAREGRAGGEKYYSLGPKFQGQLDELVGQEYMALVGRKEEVPLEFNQDVLVNLNYFLNDARGFMVRSLNRGRKYIPMMKAILRQKGLPEDLVYLALIESGFRTEAVSSASAVGPWQFIAATGRRYGLVIDEWVDERMDPVKSTYAAADYLTALHDMFNSWPLAIAAYNSGEAKIMRGMQKPEVDNYWDMAKEDGFLANETKRYVPSFLAVAIIAKDPQAYGLEIDNTPQDGWEDVIVPDAIDLQLAAELSNTTIERLKELNPQLKKGTTPPGEINFVLRVPQGARADFYKLYAQLPESQRNQSLITHTVSRSETVELVASKYNLSPEVVRQYNNIEGSKLTRGQQLVLPTSQPAAILTASATPSGSNLESGLAAASASVTTRPQQPWPDVQRTSSSRQSTQSINTISHRVRAGDTILGIAKLYAVKAEQIKTDNKLASNDIKEGQVLTIRSNLPLASSTSTRSRDSWVEVSEGAPIYHTVKKGETIGSIAASYRLSQDQLRSLNNLKSNTIRIGAKLRVGTGPAPPAQASEAGYVVRKGDTVSTIAERFGIKSDDLRRLNNLASDKIKVGETLKIAQTPSASAASSKATAIYEVKSGDAVSTIAERFKMSSNDLRTLNNLKNNNLSIGQKLKVFDPKAQPDTAAKPDPNVQIATDSAPSRNESSASDDGFYQVVSGDTVSTIAERFRMKSDELRRINSLSSDALRVGQKLKVLVGAPGAVDVSQSQPPSQSTQSTPSVQTASVYVVVSGDTVSTIAERFGMRSADLRA
ncbi:MAG: LysM peptidoglycan-binding domain-containing protein, partial [Deltaproteobacteria bacterium]|nr:LysM peptidoglycan-binding domain-containing protein [Deltaproteobacteria bacterium]